MTGSACKPQGNTACAGADGVIRPHTDTKPDFLEIEAKRLPRWRPNRIPTR